MASEMASRGRQTLGFLKRLGGLISKKDLSTIYEYFVRSKMEYGCTSYIGAAPSHLKKLDKVQRRAEKLTSSEFQSLSIRREAACFKFICKILSGECVEPLLKMCRISSWNRFLQTVIRVDSWDQIQLGVLGVRYK